MKPQNGSQLQKALALLPNTQERKKQSLKKQHLPQKSATCNISISASCHERQLGGGVRTELQLTGIDKLKK